VIQQGRILDRRSLRFDPVRNPGYRAVPLVEFLGGIATSIAPGN